LEWWAITLTQTQGRNPDSLEFMSRAVALNPSDPTAQQNLRLLKELLSHPQNRNGTWKTDDCPASGEARRFLASPEDSRIAA
jgi:hypothetical protein